MSYDSLSHWLRTEQGANVPVVQLQDPDATRGTGLLVVTDEQRAALWSAAQRESYRLQRGLFHDRWYGRVTIFFAAVGAVLGAASSIVVLLHGGHP